MALTELQVKNAKPKDKAYKLADDKGLYLLVSSSGGKLWRYDYRYADKRKTLSLGIYPDTGLANAREKLSAARKLLSDGIDPAAARKAQKTSLRARTADSFEVVAREWYEKFSDSWSDSHGTRILRRLERDVFPRIGGMPITDITPPILLDCIRKIEARGAIETAHRAMQNCGQIFRYAIACGRAQRDPTPDLRGSLVPATQTHFSAVTDPVEVSNLLKTLDCHIGGYAVRAALKLAPLLFVRPGELRNAKWADINFETAEWRYIVPKTRSPHIVPLSRQALEILTELQPHTEHSLYVFPGGRSPLKPMSDNAILAAMRELGISAEKMTGHGFRAMARTMLDEVLGFPPHIIEHQLAHAVRDPLGRAYNRTVHLQERKEMMQAWSDYLDKLKAED